MSKKTFRKIGLFSCVVILSMIFFGSGGALADQWLKTYGGTETDKAFSVQQTFDGGYVVVGSTSSFGAGKLDIWVLRLDVSGNVEWQKTYGGTEDDVASSIQQTVEGGYIVAGYTSSFGAGKKDVWVLKLDKDGNVEWQKTYGGTEDDGASSIQQIEDGGYIVAATTSSFGAGKEDIWVLKLDKDLGVEWQKTYGLPGNEEASSIRQTLDGAFIVTGVTDSFTAFKIESWILKIDSVGNIQTSWQLMYGGSGNDKVYSIEPTRDGKYIVVGSTDSFGIGKKDAWVMKLNGNGAILWQQTWGGSDDDEVFSVQETLDGGVVVAGWTSSFGAVNGDILLAKFDSNGTVPNCQHLGTSSATIKGTVISGVSASGSVNDTTVSPGTGSVSSTDTQVAPNSLCMVEGPDIFVEPTSIDFGSVTMGNSSSPQSITIENVGSQDLVLNSLDIAGANHLDFGFRENNCSGQTLRPSASCVLEVIFSPASNGKRSATLSIPSNDSDLSNVSVLLSGDGIPPITPVTPENHASFSVCSLYQLPTFSWNVAGSFKSYEVQFSKDVNFGSIAVKARTTVNQVVLKANTWKQVLLIPGGQGGPVYWRVFGIYTGGKTAFVSQARSFTVESAQSVKNAKIDPTSIGSLPILLWENNCNVKFKVWFGNDAQFSKKYSISPAPLKNPLDGDGKFNQQLTSRQWDSVRKLVGGASGSTIYWKVESWDGANRESQTATVPPMSFILGE